MKVMIDADRCTGNGRCYYRAPDILEPDDEGRGLVRLEVLSERQHQAEIRITNCPEEATSVVG